MSVLSLMVGALSFIVAICASALVGRAYARIGTVKAAMESVTLLSSEVQSLRRTVADLHNENVKLFEAIQHLTSLVPQELLHTLNLPYAWHSATGGPLGRNQL